MLRVDDEREVAREGEVAPDDNIVVVVKLLHSLTLTHTNSRRARRARLTRMHLTRLHIRLGLRHLCIGLYALC